MNFALFISKHFRHFLITWPGPVIPAVHLLLPGDLAEAEPKRCDVQQSSATVAITATVNTGLVLVVCVAHPGRMPRWLTTLVILVLLFGFVVPDPVGSGHAVGNGINSMLVFLKSAGNELGGNFSADAAGTRDARPYPTGGVGSGDGTTTGDGGGAPLLGLGSTPVPTPAPKPQTGLSYSPPVKLRIPSIGVTSGFVSLGLESDGALEVPHAADVVGWYRDAPTPGERGPAVVTAHVDWRHNRGVFHDLGRLKPGDDVMIDRADGVPVTFRVSRVAEYPKTRFPTHDVYGGTDGVELRMITCGGRFDDRTHSYDHNIVVFARMSGVG